VDTEVTKLKTKMFLLLLLSCQSKLSLYLNTGIHHSLQLPYPNLTWLLSSFGVKLDNVVKPGHHGFAAKVDSLQ